LSYREPEDHQPPKLPPPNQPNHELPHPKPDPPHPNQIVHDQPLVLPNNAANIPTSNQTYDEIKARITLENSRVINNQRARPDHAYIHRPYFFMVLFLFLLTEGTVTRRPNLDIKKMIKSKKNKKLSSLKKS
jgi:hypothetical protein